MNPQARELVDLASQLGFTFDGYDSRGHVILRLPDGQHMSIPATPGEYRGRKNAIAQMERMSGRKLPRVNHHRGRKSAATSPDLEVLASRRRHAETFEAKAAERDAERERKAARAAAAERTATAERRRREIEALMRPGY